MRPTIMTFTTEVSITPEPPPEGATVMPCGRWHRNTPGVQFHELSADDVRRVRMAEAAYQRTTRQPDTN